jgi:hypothetical protein
LTPDRTDNVPSGARLAHFEVMLHEVTPTPAKRLNGGRKITILKNYKKGLMSREIWFRIV